MINGTARSVDAEPDTPLLWVLRDILNLTGTKYGCGIGQCGACTVHVAGTPARACLTAIGTIANKPVTTIEGLARGRSSHPLQPTWIALKQAWLAEQVPQCGYCQPGMLMEATALLAGTQTQDISDADIDRLMGRHICRCGTYQRIRQAIHRAVQTQPATQPQTAPPTAAPTAQPTAPAPAPPTTTAPATKTSASGGAQ